MFNVSEELAGFIFAVVKNRSYYTTLKIQPASSSESWMHIYRSTIYHIPEDENFVVKIITDAFWPNFFISFLNGHLLSR